MRLTDFASNTFSQFGEDGVLSQLLKVIGVRHKTCVDFGAGDGNELSNTARLWREEGWRALLIESDRERFEALEGNTRLFDTIVRHATITPTGPYSIDALLTEHGIDDVDVMSIDIDGDDYFILEALTVRPRVIVIEFNPTVPPHIEVYPSEQGGTFGSSLLALIRLAERLDYRFVGATHCNAFLVHVAQAGHFVAYETDPMVLFPPDRYSYAVTDYHGRVVLCGQPLGFGAHDPYVLPLEGTTVTPVTTSPQHLRRGFESLWGPARWVGAQEDASHNADRLRDVLLPRPPLVCIDVTFQLSDGVEWVYEVAETCGYRAVLSGQVIGLIAQEEQT